MIKKGMIGLILLTFVMVVTGCGAQQAEIVETVEWDTIPPAEQTIEVTVTDNAWEHMQSDWSGKTSDTALFMLIPGSS